MPIHTCATCGLRYPESDGPPEQCAMCEDERQFVPAEGQCWVTHSDLDARHSNVFKAISPDLMGITISPTFAIGQRAILIQTPAGNILWDCISLLDEATEQIIRGMGGLSAIAVSHPHVYSATSQWGRAFDCPVFMHESDREWVVDPDPCLHFWGGETHAIQKGVTLHRMGGHFSGSSVLHWAEKGAVFTGDTVLVTADRRHVSFMWSYPNHVPLPPGDVKRIAERFAALEFDSLHSAFWGRGDIAEGAKAAVERSARRHIETCQQ